MTDTAKVLSIYHDSVVDGEGVRTVIFFAGCEHFCKGCHNPKSWNIQNGTEMTVKEIVKEALNPITDITLSGGDPFYQAPVVKQVARDLKEHGKNIWAYTGWTLEELQASKDEDKLELLTYIDVIVDGRFEIDKRDLSLQFRGSSNQEIIELDNGLRKTSYQK
ncbi:ribonucleoside-triphosphate reductase class III activase subunit [Mesobacillus persicus]|uniref:Anaerobic ribonucleoside-triphosphate reductase-activating protein n=1 Tax=Mesobacillus persicus TaxID=930146 RepID=A0A1H8J6G7_9BACI|nr:anaerobic ribonucleoside-triphosphate reductase activating protein [Mesobacillus persicus]SEN76533.1 ribonucleoside-triphosphate reductase class III activase subunit [Mesobacillus persicus]